MADVIELRAIVPARGHGRPSVIDEPVEEPVHLVAVRDAGEPALSFAMILKKIAPRTVTVGAA
jgi:hypothetical protein